MGYRTVTGYRNYSWLQETPYGYRCFVVFQQVPYIAFQTLFCFFFCNSVTKKKKTEVPRGRGAEKKVTDGLQMRLQIEPSVTAKGEAP